MSWCLTLAVRTAPPRPGRPAEARGQGGQGGPGDPGGGRAPGAPGPHEKPQEKEHFRAAVNIRFQQEATKPNMLLVDRAEVSGRLTLEKLQPSSRAPSESMGFAPSWERTQASSQASYEASSWAQRPSGMLERDP